MIWICTKYKGDRVVAGRSLKACVREIGVEYRAVLRAWRKQGGDDFEYVGSDGSWRYRRVEVLK